MRSIGQSDFAGLVQYITNEQGKTERLGAVALTNCAAETLQAVIGEVLATQRLNTRAEGDKTYHLMVSFPAGETPSAEVLCAIEQRLCAGLGFTEHQRVSAVHHDTDHLHIHIAINKIHPIRKTILEPFQSYRTLAELCVVLEKEYGLQRVNHEFKRRLSEGRAGDMEHYSGIESLVNWVKRECLDEMLAAQTWNELHQVMRINGLRLRQRANGFVIEAGDGIFVKASTVARDLSKPNLEERLGLFEQPTAQESPPIQKKYTKQPVRLRVDTAELFARYKTETQNLIQMRSDAFLRLRAQRDEQIEMAKKMNLLRRGAIQLIGENRSVKKLLYAQAHKALREKMQGVHQQYQKDRQSIYEQFQRRAWADWLKQQALAGDQEALGALRARKKRQEHPGEIIRAEGLPQPGRGAVLDNITKKGTMIYHVGASAVRDDGDQLLVSRKLSREGVQVALQLAVERYGHRITVSGTPAFKAEVIAAAATFQSQLPIIFVDQFLESKRQLFFNKEKQYEQSKRDRSERGRINRGGVGGFSRAGGVANEYAVPGVGFSNKEKRLSTGGAFNSSAGERRKPNIGDIGQVAPPDSQNRLRTLSQLGVVRIPDGSEVLLPSDVSGHLEQQGSQSVNPLRRAVPGVGAEADLKQLAAIDKYITEREEKRLKGLDILKHIRYTGIFGEFALAGMRNVDGHSLALLRRDHVVMVMAIHPETVKRLKRIALGDVVSVTPKGLIKTAKGRSR